MAEEDPELEKGKRSSKKVVVFAALGVLVLALGVSATLYFTGAFSSDEDAVAKAGEAAEPVQQEAMYVSLEPRFVVNFQTKGPHRFLQIEVELMARDDASIDAIKRHSPMIRNNLLMLFGEQESGNLATREGKDHLREQVLTEVQTILMTETGEAGVESVFFTSFVMQ